MFIRKLLCIHESLIVSSGLQNIVDRFYVRQAFYPSMFGIIIVEDLAFIVRHVSQIVQITNLSIRNVTPCLEHSNITPGIIIPISNFIDYAFIFSFRETAYHRTVITAILIQILCLQILICSGTAGAKLI